MIQKIRHPGQWAVLRLLRLFLHRPLRRVLCLQLRQRVAVRVAGHWVSFAIVWSANCR